MRSKSKSPELLSKFFYHFIRFIFIQVIQSHNVEPCDGFSQNQSEIPKEGEIKKYEKKVYSALIGSVATTLEGRRGRTSTLYNIGDYLYSNGTPACSSGRNVIMLACVNNRLPCKGRAHIEQESLQVIKLIGEHRCITDRDLKYQIQMETEMKELAETTKDSYKDIYNRVCLKNPAMESRIEFSRMCHSMESRRRAAKQKEKNNGSLLNDEQINPIVIQSEYLELHEDNSEKQDQEQHSREQRINDEKENNSLIGSVAKTMEGRLSTPLKRTTLYIIGDYLYIKAGMQINDDESKVLMLRCSTFKGLCKARAHVHPETLQVLKFPWIHSCTRDPDLKFQIQMENEMKNLADTTKDNLKDIYNKVCLKNPLIGKRIDYKRMYSTMRNRRAVTMKADQSL